MKPSVLTLLSPEALCLLLNVPKGALATYLKNPSATIEIVRISTKLIIQTTTPARINIPLEASPELMSKLNSLERNQWLSITVHADGTKSAIIDNTECATGLENFPMVMAVVDDYYDMLVDLTTRLRNFFECLPNVAKFKADLKTAVMANIEISFSRNIAAGVIGVNTVEVITPYNLLGAAVSHEFDRNLLYQIALGDLGWQPRVVTLLFMHRYPEFNTLGVEIFKNAAKTMLPEVNREIWEAFLLKIDSWKRLLNARIASDRQPRTEPQVAEPTEATEEQPTVAAVSWAAARVLRSVGLDPAGAPEAEQETAEDAPASPLTEVNPST